MKAYTRALGQTRWLCIRSRKGFGLQAAMVATSYYGLGFVTAWVPYYSCAEIGPE